MSQNGGIAAEALLDLRRRRDQLPPRHASRRAIVESAADLFGVSRATLYRALAGQLQPQGLRRVDRGKPRKIDRQELERYCEIVAALKLRTSNLKGRRLSTWRCIELLETHGVETPQGLVRAPGGLLHRATVNRYLHLWGYDHARMTRAPAAVRFEARTANALWQFDISPSDLKEIEHPARAAVVLIGHPKLRNDQRRPSMEEIGHRTDILSFEGLGEDARAYLDWLLGECTEVDTDAGALIELAALDVMAMRLNTPLQFAEHLNRAFEAGFRTGQKPVTAEIVTVTLAPDFDDLEPRLTRQGYSPKVLADQFHAKPSEIRRFLNGQLDAGGTRELADRMRAVGLAL